MIKAKMKEKRYTLEIDANEHEISILQASLGLTTLPDLVHKSFPEWSKEEIKNILLNIKDTIKNA